MKPVITDLTGLYYTYCGNIGRDNTIYHRRNIFALAFLILLVCNNTAGMVPFCYKHIFHI